LISVKLLLKNIYYLYDNNLLIREIMKKSTTPLLAVLLLVVTGLFLMNYSANGQETPKISTSLPDNISKIVSFSCVPCHTSTGGFMSKGALNLTEFANYTPKKQKQKAEKMFSMVNKGAMPPKSARETRPEIVPTQEQKDAIKKWADSLPAGE
jgi:mono/diheme cytochrome c family protein